MEWCVRQQCVDGHKEQLQALDDKEHELTQTPTHRREQTVGRQDGKNKGPARFCTLRVFLEGLRRASSGKYIACTRHDRGARIHADLAGTVALVPPSQLARLGKANLAIRTPCGRWRTGDERPSTRPTGDGYLRIVPSANLIRAKSGTLIRLDGAGRQRTCQGVKARSRGKASRASKK